MTQKTILDFHFCSPHSSQIMNDPNRAHARHHAPGRVLPRLFPQQSIQQPAQGIFGILFRGTHCGAPKKRTVQAQQNKIRFFMADSQHKIPLFRDLRCLFRAREKDAGRMLRLVTGCSTT